MTRRYTRQGTPRRPTRWQMQQMQAILRQQNHSRAAERQRTFRQAVANALVIFVFSVLGATALVLVLHFS